MYQFKIIVALVSFMLVLSCGSNNAPTASEEDPAEGLSEDITDVFEGMDFPEFDYSNIVDLFEKGDHDGAAELLEDYAEILNDIKKDLTTDQKTAIYMVVDDLESVAEEVRTKKINDADELQSECMLIDKSIAEIFITAEEGFEE